MTGYELTKAFYNELEQNEDMQTHCRSHHIALYTWICELRNRVRMEVIDLPREYTMKMSRIGSPSMLKTCIEDLARWDIIEIMAKGDRWGGSTRAKISCSFMNSDRTESEQRLNSDRTESEQRLNITKRDKTNKRNKPVKTDKDIAVEGFEHLKGKSITITDYQALVDQHGQETTDTTLNESKIKVAYRENVTLYPKERQTLISKYGQPFTELCLDKLHFAKMAKEYGYKSDYGAINTWVVGVVEKDGAKPAGTNPTTKATTKRPGASGEAR